MATGRIGRILCKLLPVEFEQLNISERLPLLECREWIKGGQDWGQEEESRFCNKDPGKVDGNLNKIMATNGEN